MKTRNWPIRSKIVALVMAPIAALLALWIFATTLTLSPALQLLDAQTLFDQVGRPGEQVVGELQRERRLSVVHLAGGDDGLALHAQRVRTDAAIADLRRDAADERLGSAASDLLSARLDQAFTALDELPAGRGFIDRGEMDRAGALGLYNGVINAAFKAFSALATLPDDDINRQARALTTLGHARDVLGQADALLAGVFTVGKYTKGEHAELVQIIGGQRMLFDTAVADLPDAERAAYQRMTEGEAFVRLHTLEEELVQGSPAGRPAINPDAWYSTYQAVSQQLREFELVQAERLAQRANPVAARVLIRLVVAGVLGLASVVASMLIALRIGRSLVSRLTGLRAAALEMASERLPEVVSRLRRGEQVDVASETPALKYGADEIGQVGQAFNAVQRTAIRSAVDEAALRLGLSEVFLNIARRSQTLLHRQLALLDRMERRTTDPTELEDLFRVDHMATRMRRHAEDLVILAGAAPGRGWRNPVPVIDVIRGAVSEAEDYARVDIDTVQPAAIVGRAVGDVIHMLAELIENATTFSPPNTRVRVSGQLVPNGYVIDVEDRGLGMRPAVIEEVNRRLASPPDFDPTNSSQLGLFVVAKLSDRHRVKVRVRPSPYGGITAVALLPTELVETVTENGVQKAVPGRTTPEEIHPEPPEPPGRALAVTAGFRRLAIAEAVPVLPTHPAPASPRRDEIRALDTGDLAVAVPEPPPLEPPPLRPVSPSTVAMVGSDGLPRRVRQTNLPPQLRRPTGGVAAERKPRDAAPRSPEEARALMSALQRGTARGRQAAGSASPAATPARGTATPARGTATPPPGAMMAPPAERNGSEPAVPETGADGHGADGHGADGHGADGHSVDGHGADGHGADATSTSVDGGALSAAENPSDTMGTDPVKGTDEQ